MFKQNLKISKVKTERIQLDLNWIANFVPSVLKLSLNFGAKNWILRRKYT